MFRSFYFLFFGRDSDILPLEEDTMQPVPMYVSDEEDNKDEIELISLNAAFYA